MDELASGRRGGGRAYREEVCKNKGRRMGHHVMVSLRFESLSATTRFRFVLFILNEQSLSTSDVTSIQEKTFIWKPGRFSCDKDKAFFQNWYGKKKESRKKELEQLLKHLAVAENNFFNLVTTTVKRGMVTFDL